MFVEGVALKTFDNCNPKQYLFISVSKETYPRNLITSSCQVLTSTRNLNLCDTPSSLKHHRTPTAYQLKWFTSFFIFIIIFWGVFFLFISFRCLKLTGRTCSTVVPEFPCLEPLTFYRLLSAWPKCSILRFLNQSTLWDNKVTGNGRGEKSRWRIYMCPSPPE